MALKTSLYLTFLMIVHNNNADITGEADECSPPIFYPQIINLQPLSSSQSGLLLTIEASSAQNADIFCVTYNVSNNEFSSHDVECASYADDIYETSESALAGADVDAAATRINSITQTLGIDITRNGHSFVIPWSDLPDFDGVSAVNIDHEDIESFTLNTPIENHYVTFLRTNEQDVYAISFDSLTSNEYTIYLLYWNQNVDIALQSTLAYDVNIYHEHNLILFQNPDEECAPFVF